MLMVAAAWVRGGGDDEDTRGGKGGGFGWWGHGEGKGVGWEMRDDPNDIVHWIWESKREEVI